ncbi:hypothetical protein P8452_43738 [Trifolium repens]|nr:hypothetical protein P8452_43738 [Trifolium repens]
MTSTKMIPGNQGEHIPLRRLDVNEVGDLCSVCFYVFLMLVVAIVGALVGNVQGLPACCRRAGQICDPVACVRGPSCDNPPSSDMKP